MNQRDTDLTTIYANLALVVFTTSNSTVEVGYAFKRIEDYIRTFDPDDYDKFLQQNKGLK